MVGAGPTGLTLAAQLRVLRCHGSAIVDRAARPGARVPGAWRCSPAPSRCSPGSASPTTMVERGNPRGAAPDAQRTAGGPRCRCSTSASTTPRIRSCCSCPRPRPKPSSASTSAQRGVTHRARRRARRPRPGSGPRRVHAAPRRRAHRDGRRLATSSAATAPTARVRAPRRDRLRRAAPTLRPSSWPTSTPTASTPAPPTPTCAEPGMLFFFPLARPGAVASARHATPRRARSVDAEPPDLAELQALVDPYTSRHGAAARPGVDDLLPDPPPPRHPLPSRAGVPRRRRRAHPQPGRRPGHEHRHPGRLEPRLEARPRRSTARRDPALLDTYQAERQPVGRSRPALHRPRLHHRHLHQPPRSALSAPTSHPGSSTSRSGPARGRATGFRTLSQLAISYRHSPPSTEGHPRPAPRPPRRRPPPRRPRRRRRHNFRPSTRPSPHRGSISSSAEPAPDVAGRHRHGARGPTRRTRPHASAHTASQRPGALVDLHGHAHRRLGLDRTDQPGPLPDPPRPPHRLPGRRDRPHRPACVPRPLACRRPNGERRLS